MKAARGASSRRGFLLALLAVAVLGVAAITWATSRGAQADVVTVDPRAAAGAKADGYVMGSESAPVEIVEFADFECPGCGQFATVTEPDVRERLVRTGKARFRLFDFQVNPIHRNAPAASLAAACAADQGKFWEMHDRIFAGQNEWNTQATSSPKTVFAGYARAIGLNATTWEQCYDARTHMGRLAAHSEEAVRRGVGSTPSFIIADKQLAGAQPYDVIKAYVDSAAARAPAAGPVAPPAPGAPAAPAAPAASAPGR
ncbi:MAG TPA: thioredoxin domain-containing protein [Gemmatirosa sp.]|nr:thioredoxin domain-containing protein [Gemmatirosa sp.]